MWSTLVLFTTHPTNNNPHVWEMEIMGLILLWKTIILCAREVFVCRSLCKKFNEILWTSSCHPKNCENFLGSNFRVCSCGLPSYPGLAYARLALVTRKFSQRRIKPTFSSLFERLYKQLYCRETKPTNQGHTWCGGSVTWKFSFSESDTIYTHT